MKKLSLLIVCMLVLSAGFAFANVSIDWIRTANITGNTGTSVARDASDNVYTTTSNGSIYLEKRDRFGTFLWQVSSSTTISFNYEYPVQVHVDPQGNPVVVGYRHTISSEGHFANSLIVLKYDANGTLVYKKNFDGTYTYFNNSQYWTKVTTQMDASGNLYIGTAGNVSGYIAWGFNAIKVSPAGNIVRVSTKTFTSNNTFHFVNKIRLSGNKLALTGVTSYSTANATTWVLDTAGTNQWSAISTGLQGKDVVFDANGNIYMLTWVSINFYGDVALYKFNSSGTQVWYHTYDFGGSDLSSRMEMTPDGNLAVMAYGNTAPNNSWYVDWITMKVDLTGTLLWSQRYDHHTNNDEIPYMMAVDANSNIFVTGIAGPFPGGSNLGKRQMVTVKYTPAGLEEWYSAIDTLTEYMTGIAVAIASDGSLYVVGSAQTLIVHYLDNTGSDPCTIPINITATGITSDAANIGWSAVSNATLYNLQYKPSTSNVWFTLSTSSPSYFLSGLFPGTIYDYQVEAVCNSGPTGYSATQQFTTSGTGYCVSEGLNATSEWIDYISVGMLSNSTPVSDGGYADYTYLSTALIQGGTYNMTLSAGMVGSHNEIWRVWIDYNQDGDFLDAGEKEVGYKSNQVGWETHSFTVKAGAKLGLTKMRVSVKRAGSAAQTACEVFSYGEVEDYTVNITPAKMDLPANENNSEDVSRPQLSVYPNPASDVLHLDLKGFEGRVNMQIFDLTGKLMQAQITEEGNQSQLDIHSLSQGLYILRITDEGGKTASAKWIKE